jgi:hypothetical protein
MGIAVERNGYTNIRQLGFDVVTDLVSNGFELEAVDGVATNSFSVSSSVYILRPTAATDPLYEITQQPWRLVMEFNETIGYINVWAITPTQINDDYSITTYDQNTESGRMSNENSNRDEVGAYFFSRVRTRTEWVCFTPNEVDISAIPMSYQLTVTDHGLFFCMWAESFDNSGDCFAWFNIQRPVHCNTGQIIVDGKSPVIAMFSKGGNSTDVNLNNLAAPAVYDSIQMFVVREADVNAPTPPVSACIATADSLPLINPIQQVAIAESQNFVIRLPHGFNTSRYLYDYKLDQIAYTSADVLSHYSTPAFTLFGEATPRKYKALNANFPDNKGMRILCQIEGVGVDDRPAPDPAPVT